MRPHKQSVMDACAAGPNSHVDPRSATFQTLMCTVNAHTLQERAQSILEDLEASRSLLSGMFKTFLRDANIKPAPKHCTSTFSPRHSTLQAKRPRDTEMPLTVTLEDLYSGTIKAVPVQRSKHDGRGHIVPVQEQLQVHVQPGLESGTRITLPGEGDENYHGTSADLTFIVQQQLHPAFRRLKDDLYAIVDVPLVTALTGGPVSLRTLSGQLLQLPVNDIITPGSELVLPDYGMPVFGDQQGRRGALHVRFNVQFPQQLSKQQQLQLSTALADCDEVNTGKSSGLSVLPQCSQHDSRHNEDESDDPGLQGCQDDHTVWRANNRHQQQQEQEPGMLAAAYSSCPSGASSYASAGLLPTGSSSLWSAAVSSSAGCCGSAAGFACTNTTGSSGDFDSHHQR